MVLLRLQVQDGRGRRGAPAAVGFRHPEERHEGRPGRAEVVQLTSLVRKRHGRSDRPERRTRVDSRQTEQARQPSPPPPEAPASEPTIVEPAVLNENDEAKRVAKELSAAVAMGCFTADDPDIPFYAKLIHLFNGTVQDY